MSHKKHCIQLLISNRADRSLFAQFLEGLGYSIHDSVVFLKEEKPLISMVITDEINAREFSSDLLFMKQQFEPVFLPLIVCILPKANGDHWLKLGFDEILHLPTPKAEFMILLRNLFRLREQTETQFKLIYENTPIGIYKITDTFQIAQANPAFLKILGFKSFEEVLNKNLFELNITFEHDRRDMFEQARKELTIQESESIWITPDKKSLYIREKINFCENEQNNSFNFIGTIEDITTQRKTQEELKASEAKFRQLVDLSPHGILIESEGKIVFLNKAMLEIFRTDDSSILLGAALMDYIPIEFQDSTRRHLDYVKKHKKSSELLEAKFLDINGTPVIIEGIACPFLFEGKPSIQLIIKDISEQEEARTKILHLAYHDQLTGLANRLKLEKELKKSIFHAKKKKNYIAVLFIDIDNFKKINDTFGHDTGDLLLQDVALKLERSVRREDVVARLGGDEFIIILNNLYTNPFTSSSRIVNKLMKLIEKPIHIKKRKLHITLSIGISIYPDNGTTSFTLFKNADIAMYLAKQSGRNTYKFCTQELEAELYEKTCLEFELYEAIANEELVVHYQPKISVQTGKIEGVEVLLQWAHPMKGLIPPLQFIPLAEATGLIVPITSMIVHKVCRQILAWKKLNLPSFSVAINLSVRNLQEPNFIQTISSILNEYKIEKNLIEFEITESLIMQNIEKNYQVLIELKKLGVQISIDDFGTGY
jgi:diguanylate cyclase (GGDEF)-like protein/PAS domain S-box-containing protein